MGGVRLPPGTPDGTTIYSRQKNAAFDEVLLQGRTRFTQAGFTPARTACVRSCGRCARGIALYYLPDMDFGPRDTLFAPFFGVQAATVTALSRIAAISGAAVVPASRASCRAAKATWCGSTRHGTNFRAPISPPTRGA